MIKQDGISIEGNNNITEEKLGIIYIKNNEIKMETNSNNNNSQNIDKELEKSTEKEIQNNEIKENDKCTILKVEGNEDKNNYKNSDKKMEEYNNNKNGESINEIINKTNFYDNEEYSNQQKNDIITIKESKDKDNENIKEKNVFSNENNQYFENKDKNFEGKKNDFNRENIEDNEEIQKNENSKTFNANNKEEKEILKLNENNNGIIQNKKNDEEYSNFNEETENKDNDKNKDSNNENLENKQLDINGNIYNNENSKNIDNLNKKEDNTNKIEKNEFTKEESNESLFEDQFLLNKENYNKEKNINNENNQNSIKQIDIIKTNENLENNKLNINEGIESDDNKNDENINNQVNNEAINNSQNIYIKNESNNNKNNGNNYKTKSKSTIMKQNEKMEILNDDKEKNNEVDIKEDNNEKEELNKSNNSSIEIIENRENKETDTSAETIEIEMDKKGRKENNSSVIKEKIRVNIDDGKNYEISNSSEKLNEDIKKNEEHIFEEFEKKEENKDSIIIEKGKEEIINKKGKIENNKTITEERLKNSNNDNLDEKHRSNRNIISKEIILDYFGEIKKNLFENLSYFNPFKISFFAKKRNNKIQRQKNLELSLLSEEIQIDKIDEFLKKIKPKGLRNLGSCCYMNATLQCFFHIKEFTSYFLKNRKEILKNEDCFLTKGLLDVILGLSKNDNNSYYIPQEFRDSLIEVDDLFDGGGGKDSGDLVETILTTCQQELIGDSDFPDFSIDQRLEKYIYYDLYYKNNEVRSIFIDLFNFYTRIECSCIECGEKYYSLSSENMILFSLEGIYGFINKKKINDDDSIGVHFINSRKIISVDECLNSYSLNGALRDNIVCKYCKKNTSILSVKSFITLPKILIMKMSRGKGEKFDCDVDFKEELDLIDFYKGIKGIQIEKNTKYKLISGTILYGSRGYGHTVAFCRHFDGNYYLFNDSSFHRTTFDEIKNEKIYLLFYQKNE